MADPTNNRTREQEARRLNDENILLQGRLGLIANRGFVFQAARRLGLAEFDFKDPATGRKGRFHTRMAGEPDPNAQRGPRLPQGMKLEDLYRDPAREQPMRDSEARQQAIEAEYQQNLRDIRSEFETADKRDLQKLTSDMAPFERNQELRGEAARGLVGLRAYENREAIEGAMQEAEEPERVRRHEEIQRLRAQQQQIMKDIQNSQLAALQGEIDTSEEGVRQQTRAKFQAEKDMYAREQAALQREIDENEKKVLQEWAAKKRQEQALQPVYPEAAILGRGAFGGGALARGIMGLLNRLRSSPQSRREEPDIQTFPTPRSRPEPEMNFKSGGVTRRYNAGGTVTPNIDPMAGKELSSSSTLSSWAAPYVTDILGKAQASAAQPYQAFTGPLTAGPSALQTQAFGGLAGLTLPTSSQTSFTPTSFTASTAEQYMNPFLQSALNPQLDEARRQAEISRVGQAGRLTRAGAYGGGRQAIMEAQLDRNLLRNLGDITGRGYATAYDRAMDQFNKEQLLGLQSTQAAQKYGLDALEAIFRGGATQRNIEQEGITADIGQFREERDYPQQQLKFMRDLIGPGMLPISTTTKDYQDPSGLANLFSILTGVTTGADLLKRFVNLLPSTPE